MQAADVDRVIVPISRGEQITFPGDGRQLSILAAHDEVTITHADCPADVQVAGPHVHRDHTDAFYVLGGELNFEIGREMAMVSLTAGGFIATPPNVAHSVRTGSRARWLNFHASDGGFAGFLRGIRDGVRTEWDMIDVPADGGLPAGEAIVSGPGDGERLESGNRLTWLKCALPELCFVEWYLRGPHPGPPSHRHEHGVDSFFVIEGEIEAVLEGNEYVAGPGTLFSVPPGVEHTFNYTGPEGARMLNIHTPDGGFADFLRRVSD